MHKNISMRSNRYYKLGENHHNWRGNNASYQSKHITIRSHLPRPAICPNCEENPATDVANISGKYSRDLDDWVWLCERCHHIFDLDKYYIDMSGRQCSLCNSTTTYIRKDTGRPKWAKLNGKIICFRCDNNRRRIERKTNL